MSEEKPIFNPPPGWPKPPSGWSPPKGWSPDPSWPAPPPGWQLWIHHGSDNVTRAEDSQRGTEGQKMDVSPEASEAVSIQQNDTAARIRSLEMEIAALRARLDAAGTTDDVILLDDERILQNAGIYRYHHPLENAAAYQERLDLLTVRITDVIKSEGAIEMSRTFTYDNSLAKGQKMANDLAKLMLRAYNSEVDNSLRSLRAGNVIIAKRRIEASRAAIKKLGGMMQMHISDSFHQLRLEEVELSADYLMKKQEEREAAIEERARLREERKVAAELEAERERLDKERSHLMNALDALRSTGSSDPDLEKRLAEIDQAITQNDFRAANIRAGYVYVISNRGAFGMDVVKIGMTRRLEPIERVNELGGASVPFRFDVHCLFFSEDAVTLETQLHQHFEDRRLNHANDRKEFFFASSAEVRDVLVSKIGSLLEFAEHAESTEYLQSVQYWPDQHKEKR
jgi:hypothetical protein